MTNLNNRNRQLIEQVAKLTAENQELTRELSLCKDSKSPISGNLVSRKKKNVKKNDTIKISN